MAFIKSSTPTKENPTRIEGKPSMPALQAIFYWLAAFVILAIIAGWQFGECPRQVEPSTYFTAQLIITCAGILLSLILFGFGQVIGYLGQTAHYTRLTYQYILNQPAQIPPTNDTDRA